MFFYNIIFIGVSWLREFGVSYFFIVVIVFSFVVIKLFLLVGKSIFMEILIVSLCFCV